MQLCCFLLDVGSVVTSRQRGRARDQHGLGSKPTRAILFPANNAMQGPYGPYKGCPYGTRTDLAAGAAVASHGLTARVSCSSNYYNYCGLNYCSFL